MKTIKNRVGCVFPGQGSQQIGMLKELASEYTIIKEVFNDARDILGYDLWNIAQNGPIAQLNQTEFTQPILLTSEYALWLLLKQKYSFDPIFFAGHSLGEFTANLCAGVFSFENALKIVSIRGKLMQEAVSSETGAMAAIIGLRNDVVTQICEQISHIPGKKVCVANLNAPGQVVVAGYMAGVNHVIELAKLNKAKQAKILPVSVAAHSFFMDNVSKQMEEVLENIEMKMPNSTVFYNVNASTVNSISQVKKLLQQQVNSPVHWMRLQQVFAESNVSLILEIGPGNVLTGLAKYTIPQVKFIPINAGYNLKMLDQFCALNE